MLQKFQLYFPISPFQYFKVSGFEAYYIGDKMQKVLNFDAKSLFVPESLDIEEVWY